jgi:hypothetical protein
MKVDDRFGTRRKMRKSWQSGMDFARRWSLQIGGGSVVGQQTLAGKDCQSVGA